MIFDGFSSFLLKIGYISISVEIEKNRSKLWFFGVKCMENGPNTLQLHKKPFRNTLYTHSGDYKAIGADFRIFTILGFFCRIAGGGVDV